MPMRAEPFVRLFILIAAVLVASIPARGSAQTTPTPIATPLDAFQCYEIHRPRLDQPGVTLTDGFGPSTVTIRRRKRLCAPVSVDGSNPTAPGEPAHLTAFTIKQNSPRFARIPDLTVTNQLGSFDVDLVRPDRLLVPTAKSLTGTPPALAALLDHFKCYRVKGARFHAEGVSMQDQFGDSTVDILKPLHLCTPVDKNGEGIHDPETHLMCFQARGPRPSFTGDVFTVDQFGADDFRLSGSREECFPSLVIYANVFWEANDNGKDYETPSCVEQWSGSACLGHPVHRFGDTCVEASDPETPLPRADFIREAYAYSATIPVCNKKQCCHKRQLDPPFSCVDYCPDNCVVRECQASFPTAAGCAAVPSARCVCDMCD